MMSSLIGKLSKSQYASLVLKANLLDTTVADIAYDATKDEPLRISEDRECFWCRTKGQLYIDYQDSYDYYNVAGQMHQIVLSNYPVIVCDNCGETDDDVEISYNVDNIIDLHVAESLRTSKKVPETIDLSFSNEPNQKESIDMKLKSLLENAEDQTFVCYKNETDKQIYYLCFQDNQFIQMDNQRRLRKRNPIKAAEFLENIYDSDQVSIIGKGQYNQKLDLSPFYL